METKFFDAVFIYKDKDGKEHQEKHHVKSYDKVLKILFAMKKGKVDLRRIRIYDFFGTKYKEVYTYVDFPLIPGYDTYKKAMSRDEFIEDLGV